jgi:serine/threonine-protein kinase
VPKSFRGYIIKHRIGAGGMSSVYLGEHPTLGYPVAVKVLHHELAEDDGFIARFEREAQTAASIRSHNIVGIIDFGREDDTYFIVMEYVDGCDFRALFDALQTPGRPPTAFPTEVALALLEEVAYGLQAAHDKGIIHRDIKPNNVILSRDGVVKLADFGLARDVRRMSQVMSSDLTMPGTVLGTPSYMSPEQAAGRADLDHRTDIFSYGVMAYLMLTGEKPFPGETPTAVQESIINDPPPPLTAARCPLLTTELQAMMDKLLAKDRDKRFADMSEVLPALQRAMTSVAFTGERLGNRRPLLARFAKDPAAVREELCQENIKLHLHRGFHYRNQGSRSIGDAAREFQLVLNLDPGNAKAAAALEELRPAVAEAEASASERTRAMDAATRVLRPAAAQPSAHPPTSPPPRPRRRLLPRPRAIAGWAAAAIVVAAIWLVVAASRGPHAPASTTVSPLPTVAARPPDSTGAARTGPPDGQTAAKTPPSDLRPAEPAAKPRDEDLAAAKVREPVAETATPQQRPPVSPVPPAERSSTVAAESRAATAPRSAVPPTTDKDTLAAQDPGRGPDVARTSPPVTATRTPLGALDFTDEAGAVVISLQTGWTLLQGSAGDVVFSFTNGTATCNVMRASGSDLQTAFTAAEEQARREIPGYKRVESPSTLRVGDRQYASVFFSGTSNARAAKGVVGAVATPRATVVFIGIAPTHAVADLNAMTQICYTLR